DFFLAFKPHVHITGGNSFKVHRQSKRFVAPFCGSKQSFQKPPTYNPQDFPLLAVFQQIKHLKDNSSRQNHLVIVGFLG
ncbi:MAG: hypothetical protein WAZ23_10915, partial [Gemmiger qucibialis]